jgi:hypothetical protein
MMCAKQERIYTAAWKRVLSEKKIAGFESILITFAKREKQAVFAKMEML